MTLALIWLTGICIFTMPGCSDDPVMSVAPTSPLTDDEAHRLAWAGAVNLGRGTPMRTAPTGSMQPILGGYEWCLVDTGVSWEDIEPGMIVAYRTDYHPLAVAHRVYRKQGDVLTMCGQSLDGVDPFPVHAADVVGVVVGVFYFER